jgi:hypothetical protein
MILMPANALSISLCTRSTSDLRNVCSCRSSDESPLSPSIEFEVKRSTEDMVLSASTSIWVSGLEILFSTKLPVSAFPSDESDFSAGAAEDDGGEFIGVFFETEFDFNSCLKPNDISNLVNNCLVDIPLGKFALYANERPLVWNWQILLQNYFWPLNAQH